MELPVVNHPDYVAKINDDNKFPIQKFGALADHLIKEGVVGFFLGGELGLDVDVLIKKISNLSNNWGKQHKFETGGRDFKVVFNNIKVVELVSFVAAFGVLFSRVRVD